jgi:SsrA-binding protein
VPLSLYFKDGKVKVELGVAKGKTGADRRDSIAEREAKREMDRAKRR